MSALKTIAPAPSSSLKKAPRTGATAPWTGIRRASLVSVQSSAAVAVGEKKTDKFVSITYKLSCATSAALLVKTLYSLYLHLSTFDTNEVTKTVILSMLSKVSILISNIVISYSVADAADRGRLDSSTFKILNLSIFLASVIGSVKPLFTLKAIFSSLTAALIWLDQLFRLKGSFKALRVHKTYDYKSITTTLKTSNLLSRSFLAAAGATFINSAVNCNKMLRVDASALGVNGLLINSYNLFPVIVYPSALVALGNAAAAGPKRMASQTYLNLGMVTLLLGLTDMFIQQSISKSAGEMALRMALPAVAFMAATELLRIGVEENVLRVRAECLGQQRD